VQAELITTHVKRLPANGEQGICDDLDDVTRATRAGEAGLRKRIGRIVWCLLFLSQLCVVDEVSVLSVATESLLACDPSQTRACFMRIFVPFFPSHFLLLPTHSEIRRLLLHSAHDPTHDSYCTRPGRPWLREVLLLCALEHYLQVLHSGWSSWGSRRSQPGQRRAGGQGTLFRYELSIS
jgi:hypothetical protein